MVTMKTRWCYLNEPTLLLPLSIMKHHLLILFVFFATSLQQSFATEPLFNACNCESDSKCNAAKLGDLKNSIQKSIYAKFGYYINDSIFLRFSVGEKGKIKIVESFVLYHEKALIETISSLEKAGDSLCPNAEEYAFAIKVDLPEELYEYPETEYVDRPVPVVGAETFNKKGQSGAARYLAYHMAAKLKEEKKPKGDHSGRIYLHGGNVVAVKITSYDPEKYYADIIAPMFYEANQDLINSNEVMNSDDQWIPFSIAPIRDSSKRYNYLLENLEYLQTLQNKHAFLKALMEFSERYYSEKERTEFLFQQLINAGYSRTGQFSLDGAVYKIDSIATYEPQAESEDDEILNFAMVESVPKFQGCEKLKDNEELRMCFQRGILTYVAKSFKFPEVARQSGIQGRNYTNFVVEKDGSIGMVEIVRGTHPLLDFEAIRVVSEIPHVDPAMQKGKPVRMSFTLPINARLE